MSTTSGMLKLPVKSTLFFGKEVTYFYIINNIYIFWKPAVNTQS